MSHTQCGWARDIKVPVVLALLRTASFRAYRVRLIRQRGGASSEPRQGRQTIAQCVSTGNANESRSPGTGRNGQAGKRARDPSVAPFRG